MPEDAPGPARTNEFQPRSTIRQLNDRSTEYSPPTHYDSSRLGLKHSDEISMDVRLHARRRPERQELIRNRRLR